jgi:hypothetical protein
MEMAIAFTRIVVQQYEDFPPVGLGKTTGKIPINEPAPSAISLAKGPKTALELEKPQGDL